jgi:hypothetical protein
MSGAVYLPSGSSYWIGANADSGNRLRLHHDGNDAYVDYATNLYFRSGINTMMSLHGDGSVQMLGNLTIGTPDVIRILTVDGDIQVGSHRGHENVPLGYARKVDFGAYENYDNIWIARYNQAPDHSELRINIGDDWGAGDRFAVGATADGAWLEGLAVLANGNVGIGVPSPAYKLEVNGTIRTQEVLIETTNWPAWPDFVFSPEYRLPPLERVAGHIKEHRHLPDIPSAEEVAERGIQLGEMQSKLLQKIEELTLYAIEQNKAIEELKKEIEALKNNR